MTPTIYNFSSVPNTGDRYCSPHLYFPWLKNCPVKMPEEYVPGRSIFGGGGLFHPGTDHHIYYAVRSKTPTVIWGAGLNYHGIHAQIYPKFLDDCPLVGLREPHNPWTWVPCVSCMAEVFDSARNAYPTNKVVVYEHAGAPFHELLPGVPFKNNSESIDLKEAIDFLASGELVVTNTFHGAYWSGLLERRVVIFKPFSNRFMALGDQTKCNEAGLARAIVDTKIRFRPPAVTLERARNINRGWAEKVRRYFGL